MQNKKLLYSLIFSVSWAFNIFFRKIALNQGVEPLPFLLTSSFVSVILLSLYVALLKRGKLTVFRTMPIAKLVVLMGLLVGAAWVFDTLGLSATSSINYSFILKTGFIFSIIFGLVFFREKITKTKLWLILVFGIGSYLITLQGSSFVPAAGDTLVILAALFYSGSTVAQKFLTKKVDPEVVGWARVSSAFLILFVWMSIIGSMNFTFESPTYILLAGILLSFTTVFINKALSVSSVSYLTMMTMTVPVISTILGLLFLKETMNIYEVLGGFLIVCGGIVVNKLKI